MEKSFQLPTLDFQNFKSANAEYFSAYLNLLQDQLTNFENNNNNEYATIINVWVLLFP